jgi:glutathione S-transferase
MAYPFTILVTLLAVILIFAVSATVSRARRKHNIASPKTSGNETFERVFRSHANTIEQAVVFFPALWLAAFTSSDALAAGVGALWLVGRVLYVRGYVAEAKKRAAGMMLTGFSTVALVVIALVQLVRSFMA